MSNPYESEQILRNDDGTMHPGGLRLTARAARLAGLAPGMRVVDYGCGTGVTAFYLSREIGVDATGVDVSEALVKEGRGLFPGLNLTASPDGEIPTAAQGLDAVFAECSLSVIGDIGEPLRRFYGALAEGGRLVISDVYLRRPDAGNFLWTMDELRGFIEDSGFFILHCEDHTPALRTYAARLFEEGSGSACCSPLFAKMPEKTPFSALGYVLIIAEKRAEK